MPKQHQASLRRLIGWITLLAGGCAPALGLHHDSPMLEDVQRESRPRMEFAAGTAVREPSDLDELMALAVLYHPDLQSARSRVEAAQGAMLQAGLYPNPIIGPRFNQIGNRENPTGEAGAFLSQQFVTAGKLQIARSAAALGVEAADWQAISKWFEVLTRVRATYYELLTALRERDTVEDILRVADKALDDARTLEKKGAGNRPDVLRANVEKEQNRLKREIALRRVEAARQNLITALGRPAITLERVEQNRLELERTPPQYEWKAMVDWMREWSSELQEARAIIAQREKWVAKAIAEVTPNIDVTAIPFYESPHREFRGQIVITAPLPIFNRNQGNILAAKADVARGHAEERQTELRLTERLTAAYQRYQAAHQQADTYRQTIVPQARESLKLIEAGYRLGDVKYDYTAVQQAQHVLFQAQLSETQSLGELWRSVVEIAGILQHPNLHADCSRK